MSWMKRVTFKRRLLIFSLFLSIAPVMIIGVLASMIASKSLQEEVDGHQQTALTRSCRS